MVEFTGQAVEPKKKEDSDSEEEPPDEVRLWEDGFKERYYSSKFDCGEGNIEFRYKLAHEYVLGLCWVLQYYYQGCASWKWYFPYHYAPFASDFVNIGSLSTKFEKGTKPFRPLEQLMGVFPAASSSHVPEPWAVLMSDPDSLIVDFYPVDFKIDLNGKKFAWQGVALLPFVNELRLFEALEPYYKLLTSAERQLVRGRFVRRTIVRRNVRGDDRLYISKHHPEFSFINALYDSKSDMQQEFERSIEGMRGRLLLSEDRVLLGETIDSPVKGLDDLKHNSTVCIRFRDPKYDDNFIFPAKKLPNAVMPPRILRPEDFNNMNSRGRGNWRPQIGMAPARQRVSLNAGGHRMLKGFRSSSGGNWREQGSRNSRGGHQDSGGSGGGHYSQHQQRRFTPYETPRHVSTISSSQVSSRNVHGIFVVVVFFLKVYGNAS
ncbi:hypothetical protein B566_EDAN014395 [Ephemera danica]|nr:hypothetical protein B566_EDAN014395 [Ephemera danica]